MLVVVVSKGSGDGVCVCGRAKCSQADGGSESGAGSVRKKVKVIGCDVWEWRMCCVW